MAILNFDKIKNIILEKSETLKKVVEKSNELKLENPELSNKEATKLALDEIKNQN